MSGFMATSLFHGWLPQIFVDCNKFNAAIAGEINEALIEWTLKEYSYKRRESN